MEHTNIQPQPAEDIAQPTQPQQQPQIPSDNSALKLQIAQANDKEPAIMKEEGSKSEEVSLAMEEEVAVVAKEVEATLPMEEEAPTVEKQAEKNESAAEQKQSKQQQPKQEGMPSVFLALENEIGLEKESLYLKLGHIFLKGYSEEEKEKIEELLDAWKTYDTEELLDLQDFVGEESVRFYEEVEMLGARAYLKAMEYVKRKRVEREGEWKDFNSFLYDHELEYSFHRHFWRRKDVKPSGISYGDFGVKRQFEHQQFTNQEVAKVNEWIQHSQLEPLKKLHQFLISTKLLTLNDETPNGLIVKLQRISKQDQKELFLKSMACEKYEETKGLHTQKFQYENQKKESEAAMRMAFPNYCFYKESEGQRSIPSLHSKFQNYTFLENRHDYIQWMFPNHYGSAFNSKSSPLSYLEKQLALRDLHIGLRLLKSIYIFLDFMGIRLHPATLNLTVCSQERLKAVILLHYHNHLRIMRLLACLSVTGFRSIALSLIRLLDQLTQEHGFLSRERQEFENSWQIYGDETPGVPRKEAKAMCFLELQEFPPSHAILSKLSNALTPTQQKQYDIVFEDFV